MMAVMSVPVVETFASHKFAKVTSISGQTSDGNTHVIIDIENLLLMVGQIMGALFQ